MLRIFISYHHKREQNLKNELSNLIYKLGDYYEIKDNSVNIGDIDPNLPDKIIYRTIREQFVKDTNITIVILGKHTKCRKHIDREIGSSLSRYGSFSRRSESSLIILLTDDFIKENKMNHEFDNKDYSYLISEQNSGQRIYNNVKNGYAVVDSFRNIILNPSILKVLFVKSQSNAKRNKPDNTAPFRIYNAEECPAE